jgi:hypothetical protein
MKKRNRKPDGKGKNGPKLLVAMTGKASAAKAAEGDKPVFDYIASLPRPQRGIAERIDALAAKTLPNLQRAVKWGMAYYGVGGGWCFSARSPGYCGSRPHTNYGACQNERLSSLPHVTALVRSRIRSRSRAAAWCLRNMTALPTRVSMGV